MKHIVVDLEMNHLARDYKEERIICSMEVIEIGAVVLDEAYAEIGSFKTFVKPQYNDEINRTSESFRRNLDFTRVCQFRVAFCVALVSGRSGRDSC